MASRTQSEATRLARIRRLSSVVSRETDLQSFCFSPLRQPLAAILWMNLRGRVGTTGLGPSDIEHGKKPGEREFVSVPGSEPSQAAVRRTLPSVSRETAGRLGSRAASPRALTHRVLDRAFAMGRQASRRRSVLRQEVPHQVALPNPRLPLAPRTPFRVKLARPPQRGQSPGRRRRFPDPVQLSATAAPVSRVRKASCLQSPAHYHVGLLAALTPISSGLPTRFRSVNRAAGSTSVDQAKRRPVSHETGRRSHSV